ncbi:FAD:protein FMN transferase [bacterium]|nr:FAD:protein FMN transferase [bacterium]
MKKIVFFLILFTFISCSKREVEFQTISFWGMGTSLSITYEGSKNLKLEEEIKNYIREFEKEASYHNPESKISEINRVGYQKEIQISNELCQIIEKSIQFAKDTDGAFDITYKSEGFLWDIEKESVPTDSDVIKYKKLIGIDLLNVDCNKNSVSTKKEGVKIDVGGVAKGAAIDKTSLILKKYNQKNYLINYGGDILVCGKKRGKNWKLGIKDPFKKNEFFKIIEFDNKSCYSSATSGDYERYFIKDGKKYSHIIDPKTGYPVDGAHSVTVIADNATIADTLATAISVRHYDEDFIKKIMKKFNVKLYLLSGKSLNLKEYFP